MSHTPPPWRFDKNPSEYADLVIEDATGNTIAEVNIQASDFTELDPEVRHISRDEGFANARLIVAAPLLYDALLQALDRMEAMEEDRYNGFSPACEAAITFARKVLLEVGS